MAKYLDINGVATIWNQIKKTFLKKNENAASATKDSEGNVINTTYETKANAITGLSASGKTITVTKGDGKTSTITTQDTTYSAATTSKEGLMSAADKTKLDGVSTGATKITVDSAISNSSTNPVQNKVVSEALNNKVDKVNGKGLSANDYTTAEKNKLAGLENYTLTKEKVVAALGYTPPSTDATVTGLSVNGNTITVTKGDGKTSTITTQDTTYSAATTSKEGLMSAADKTKLDGITVVNNTADSNKKVYQAEYATKDSAGNTISDTYATNAEVKSLIKSVESSEVGFVFKDGTGNTVAFVPSSKVKRYGYRIKQAESDPYARVEYLYDAVGMTPAKMNFTNGVFNYGSWGDIWFVKDNRPLMLKSDGTVGYYLNPNDYSKKEDGTTSDVANDNYDGNAMAQIPLCWVKRYQDDEYIYEIVSNVQYDKDYKAYAHTRADGSIADYFYWGMFRGSGSATKIRSLSGKTLAQSLMIQAEVDGCKANGEGWYIHTWSQLQLMRTLLTLIGKSTDTQSIFGNGNILSNADSVLSTGTLNNKGQFYGSTANNQNVKAFHIEGVWGNILDTITGLLSYDGKIYVKMTPEGEGYRVTDVEGYIDTNIPYLRMVTEYIKTVECSEYGCVPTGVGGSTSTYYCDVFAGTNMETNIKNKILHLTVGGNAVYQTALGGMWAFSMRTDKSVYASKLEGCALSYV